MYMHNKRKVVMDDLIKLRVDVCGASDRIRGLLTHHAVEVQGKSGVRIYVVPRRIAHYVSEHAPKSVLGSPTYATPPYTPASEAS